MANEFFDPGAQRATKVRSLFDRIARKYDLLNDIQSLGFHRLWKRKVARLANTKAGDRALDLCCGTGDLACRLAKAGAKVVGLDFSSEMLVRAAKRMRYPAGGANERGAYGVPPSDGEVQKERARETRPNRLKAELHASAVTRGNGSASICLIRGDAQRLPFQERTFDIITMGYGLRNLSDWQAGLAEMRRVLKPGGRIVLLEFGSPESAVWQRLYFGYLRLAVPLLGLIFHGTASTYSYILESLKHYSGPKAVADQLRSLGLERVTNDNILGGAMTITYGTLPGEKQMSQNG